ncbi:MAG: N-acetylneuraminate synthase [Gammaproteobacteria bacterium]|nr:N-acetylneuraminate synthase [Gammaproteobacteria bacterium]
MSVFIIAEAGVNHNGDPEMAFQLVDAAAAAGVDAVKFQTFKAENLATSRADKASYQKQTTDSRETQLAMLMRLELSHEMHYKLKQYCQDKGVQFLSTAFDFDSLAFLVSEMKLEMLKIPSGELTNGPLLLAHAKSGKEIILSTGMATLGEIETALGVIAYGYIGVGAPSMNAFQSAFYSDKGIASLQEKVTLLHCTTEYPAPMTDINLRAMDTMAQAFRLRVGYSDHSNGITVPIAAVARGATIIEKHFTLDRTLPGPDHKASLEPNELKAMVQAIRDTEKSLGDGKKGPRPSELNNRDIARKSLVAATHINKGDVLSKENLALKRPGTGRSPMEYWSLLGKVSDQNIDYDEQV